MSTDSRKIRESTETASKRTGARRGIAGPSMAELEAELEKRAHVRDEWAELWNEALPHEQALALGVLRYVVAARRMGRQ